MKPILRYVKCIIPTKDANITPPLGPLLGQFGVNIKDFCLKFNEFTFKRDPDINCIVIITIFKDKSFIFSVGLPSVAFLLLEEELYLYKNLLKEKYFQKNYNFFYVDLKKKKNDILKKNKVNFFSLFDLNIDFFFFKSFVVYFAFNKFYVEYFLQISYLFDVFLSGKFLEDISYKPFFSLQVPISLIKNTNFVDDINSNRFGLFFSLYNKNFAEIKISLINNSFIDEDSEYFFFPKKIHLSTIYKIANFICYSNNLVAHRSFFRCLLSSVYSMHFVIIDDLV